jgi:hypothetical protein
MTPNRSETISSLLKSAEKSLSFISKPNTQHKLTLSLDQSTRIAELSDKFDQLLEIVQNQATATSAAVLTIERRLDARLDEALRRLTLVTALEQRISKIQTQVNENSETIANISAENMAKMEGLAKAVAKAVKKVGK